MYSKPKPEKGNVQVEKGNLSSRHMRLCVCVYYYRWLDPGYGISRITVLLKTLCSCNTL